MGDQSQLHYRRISRLLTRFSRTEIELILVPPDGEQFSVARVLLDLLPLLAKIAPALLVPLSESTKLVDLRGRPRETFIVPPIGLKDEQPRREELLALVGRFVCSDLVNAPEEEPWFFQILSQFNAFRGPQHIVHSCGLSSFGFSDDVAKRLSLAQIGYLFPVEITELRVGLEFYRSRFRGSMLSFAAGIEERLYLELATNRFRAFFADDYSLTGRSTSFVNSSDPIGHTMQKIIERSLNVSGVFSRLKELEQLRERAIDRVEPVFAKAKDR